MSDCVVEVGPATVRGPLPAPDEVVAAALSFVDDEVAIIDDAPVMVDALWRRLFEEVLPDDSGTAVLICPTWWPPTRVRRVRAAAAATSLDVSVLQRCEVLGDETGHSTVVELAPELVLTTRAGAVVAADPRLGETADIAGLVAARIGPSTSVLVDAPVGVAGGDELAVAIAERLRACGAAATIAHQDKVLRITPTSQSSRARPDEPEPRRRDKSVMLAVLLVSVTAFCIGVALTTGERDADPIPTTLLVEGRVAVKVPALWAVQRVTAGPGSARLQAMAPDGSVGLLVTQSRVREGETLSGTSATLRRALDDQPAGVFSQFNADDRRANRPAITYRELRDGRQIDWAVFVDDTVRIAVGCQTPPGAEDAVRAVCDEAIRSAHAVV